MLCIQSSVSFGVTFNKQTISKRFVAEGCAVADFDKDGHADITAGNNIWFGPQFDERVVFTPPANNPSGPSKTPYDPKRGYSDYFLAFTYDFNSDGWSDILVYGLPGKPALVFVNPQGRDKGYWSQHAVFDIADGESPGLRDMNADGRPELFVHSSDGNKKGGQLGFAKIDWQQPLSKAAFHPITPRSPENDKKYFRYTHGSGAGDMNGDNRVDILTKDGWFEQPPSSESPTFWEFHPGPFGPPNARGGAQMYVRDVNGDGRSDVITSLDAHGYGLAWFEQKENGAFREHIILNHTPDEQPSGISFSQLHAVAMTDIDGDGLDDIVTGKRRWAHGISGDVEPNAPPVLYWFGLQRNDSGEATFVPHLIDNDSGVGTQVTTADLNNDGRPDIIVANKHGVFAFRQQ